MTQLPMFNNVSIAVIGDVMLDSYWYGNTQRISPEAPVPVVKVADDDKRPGGAANVALNIRALGAQVKLFGLSGDDLDGRELAQCLIQHGIDNCVIKNTEVQTINKLRILCQSQQLLRLDFEHTYQQIDKAILHQKFIDNLKNTNLVIASDYAKGTLSSLPKLIKQCNKLQIPILIDPKGDDYSKYSGATMLTPNLKEFELVMGNSNTESEFLEKGQQMLVQYQLKNLLVTRGADGMTLFRIEQAPYHLKAQAKAVYDVTGAGDTVIGVLSTCLAAGISSNQALELANYAAGLVVGQVGAATVSPAELNGFYNNQTVMTFSNLVNQVQQHKKANELYHIEFCSESQLSIVKLHRLLKLKQQGLYIYIGLNDLALQDEQDRVFALVTQMDFIENCCFLSEQEFDLLSQNAAHAVYG